MPQIFNGLIGNSIVPGQKFLAPFKFLDFNEDIAIFDITYHNGKKHYTDHIEIAVKSFGKLVKPRIMDKEYKSISYPLQEIAERLM